MSRILPDLEHLGLLVGVSELGSVGAAARAVGMAQPNASRALSRLERQLGLTLLERSPAGSRLTTQGTLVVQWARGVLDASDQLVVGAQALRSQHRAHLDVCASMTVAEYLVPKWLAEFRRRHPTVQINLQVHNSFDVFDRVRDGACHLGFVEAPSVTSGLRSAIVGRDRLTVVVSPDHPWARRRKPVTAAELAATPLIVRETGSGTRITLESMLRGHALAEPALELSSNSAVRISAVAGIAPAVLSTLAVAAAVEAGQLRSVPVEGLRLDRALRAVWVASRQLEDHALDLLHIARSSSRSRPLGLGTRP
jgi:DNA-binding transcriptional LysR family regulator